MECEGSRYDESKSTESRIDDEGKSTELRIDDKMWVKELGLYTNDHNVLLSNTKW